MSDFDLKQIYEYHHNELELFNLPEWITSFKCPKCEKPVGLISLRELGLKLNAQHMGNFYVEICCKNCTYGYELHIENACNNLEDLIKILQDTSKTKSLIPDFQIQCGKNNLINRTTKKGGINGNSQTQQM